MVFHLPVAVGVDVGGGWLVDVGGAQGLGKGLVLSVPTGTLVGLVWAGWDCVVGGKSPAKGFAS